MRQQVLGADLRVGDTIETWWAPGRDTIVSLRPYQGVYEGTILKGARIAGFGLNPTGMTIEAGMLFTVISRTGDN